MCFSKSTAYERDPNTKLQCKEESADKAPESLEAQSMHTRCPTLGSKPYNPFTGIYIYMHRALVPSFPILNININITININIKNRKNKYTYMLPPSVIRAFCGYPCLF